MVTDLKLLVAPEGLLDLPLHLQEQPPLRVGHAGRFARGRALQATVAAAAVKARPVALNRDMSVEDGFRVILGNCLMQMQANEDGVARGVDPESIHQMRVGMRRLRSALRLFAPWIPFPPALRRELRWLGGELGAARDADVLADSTLLTVIEACPQEAELLPLAQFASKIARHKRKQAAASVASVRCSRLMLGMLGWLQTSRWRESLDETAIAALAQPLEKRATRILTRRHEKLIESGKRLAHASPEERHQVRIEAKKARYATEFFQSLRPAERVERYIRRLAALQDALGWLNDATVADRSLREIATSRPGLAGSAGFARGYLFAATQQDLRGLGRLWKQFRSTAPP